MTQELTKKYVSCPVCGRLLMKCQGQCDIEIVCSKCNSEVAVFVNEKGFSILEKRRKTGENEK